MRFAPVQVLLAVALAGCVTVGGVRNAAPDAGTVRAFDAGAAEMLEVTRDALVAGYFETREERPENDSTWFILATHAAPTTGLSQIVRVRIEGVSRGSTRVWAYGRSLPAKGVNAQTDPAAEILRRIEKELQLRKSRTAASTPLEAN